MAKALRDPGFHRVGASDVDHRNGGCGLENGPSGWPLCHDDIDRDAEQFIGQCRDSAKDIVGVSRFDGQVAPLDIAEID